LTTSVSSKFATSSLPLVQAQKVDYQHKNLLGTQIEGLDLSDLYPSL
jgi:hypothetical protein